MTQFSHSLLDGVSRLVTDAMGAAEGVKRELSTATRSQIEKVLNDCGVVKRDEFEAVKAIAVAAREENEHLRARIAALEARIGTNT